MVLIALPILGAIALILYYLWFGNSWLAVTEKRINVFHSESVPAYEGTNIKTPPPFDSIPAGARVAVLFDTYGKDYWSCYIRMPNGNRGWVLCTDLDRVPDSGT